MILIPCYLLLDLGLCRGGRRCKSTWPSSWLPSRCCNYTFVHVYSDQLNSFAVVFQKGYGANPFKIKVPFAVYFSYPYYCRWCKNLLRRMELSGFAFTLVKTVCFFFSVLFWCECNDSTFGVSILTVFYMKCYLKSMRRLQGLVARMPCYVIKVFFFISTLVEDY